MAERLLEAWETVERQSPNEAKITPFGEASTGEADEQLIPDDSHERVVYARRIVAQRCLYGVDVNPLAADMAKLSLWLLTLAKDKPFTFLDHSIRCGDSLVGINSIKQLERFSLDGGGFQQNFAQEQVKRRIDAAQSLRQQLERLPTNAVEDIDRKTEMLKRADEQAGRLRYAADMMLAVEWLALPSAERETKLHETLLDVEFKFKDLPVDQLRQESDKRLSEVGCRPTFNWPLEFPEVFHRGGFDAIVGNPPFLWGARISTNFGDKYLKWLLLVFEGSHGTSDYCGYFFRNANRLLKSDGAFGLLATNSISETATRRSSLEPISDSGTTIIYAESNRPWVGTAGLHVAIVVAKRGEYRGTKLLNGETKLSISAFLKEKMELPPPKKLKQNEDTGFKGVDTGGLGFVVSHSEEESAVTENPISASLIWPFINGDDLLSSPSHSASRRIINFSGLALDQAKQHVELMKIVEDRVRPHRMTVKRKANRDNWWLYNWPRPDLYGKIKDSKRVLVNCVVAKYACFAFLQPRQVFSNALNVFVTEDYRVFGALQSTFHDHWCRTFGSSLETRLRYNPTDCFETFVLPLNEKGVPDELTEVAELYYQLRSAILEQRNEGLTKTYNRFHDSGETAGDIDDLRQLHVRLDQAVSSSYGWSDLELKYDFHETPLGVRFTLPDSTKHLALERLLKLNHERYEDEVKHGLHNKKRGKKKAKATPKPKKKAAIQAATLFPDED